MTEKHEREFAQPPDPMTEPCSRFFRDYMQLWGFFGFVSSLAMRTDTRAASKFDLPQPVSGNDLQV